MAEFVCRLGTAGGDVVTRTMEANAERELRTRLEREGYHVFSISSSSGSSSMLGGKSAKRIKLADFLTYNQQLSALLRAGLTWSPGLAHAAGPIGFRRQQFPIRELVRLRPRLRRGDFLRRGFRLLRLPRFA